MFSKEDSSEKAMMQDLCEGVTLANRAATMMWFLSGRIRSDGPLVHIPVDAAPFSIGRKAKLNLCLASNSVSSVHAELIDTGDGLLLRDLASTNGTFVNGQRITREQELRPDDLIQFADTPFRVMRQNVPEGSSTAPADLVDQATSLVMFDRLMQEQAVLPHYQPIVRLQGGGIVGYEVLARSNLCSLKMPDAMFSAAAQLGLEVELSQMIRVIAIQECLAIENPPHLFLNTHPIELERPGLVESIRSLRAMRKSQKITLEIHEKAVTNRANMQPICDQLRELEVGVAFDDFGAGQARLTELVDLRPEYVKFDISLVRGLHEATDERWRMVQSLVSMTRDLGAAPLAEGIECFEERRACEELGFELAQGYLFGRPVAMRMQ